MPNDDRAYRVSEALRQGVPPARIRGPQLHAPFWGVRSALPLTPERGFAPRMPPHAFYIGLSAARVYGLPLPTRLSGDPRVDVGVPIGRRRPSAKGVRPHHVTIASIDLAVVEGMRITTPARTWCDLAASGLRLPELVAVGDALIHEESGLCDRHELRRALARYEGRRGAAVMRAAIDLLSTKADSAPESELRVACIAAGLPRPAVNEEIQLPRGRVASPDLSWPRWKVAVEYEGDHHRTERRQWRYDIARYNELADLGWRVIRATGADYRDSRSLIARLAALIPPDEPREYSL